MAACSQKPTATTDTGNKGDISGIAFEVAKNYFFKNNQEIPSSPKITTAEEFGKLFGMATTMGEDGKPTEIDRLSVKREPGVICLFPMQDPADSCQIRILEIYANDAVYQAHLKTDHFQKYKQGTLKMVKSLKLNTMQPTNKEIMKAMFGKMKQ